MKRITVPMYIPVRVTVMVALLAVLGGGGCGGEQVGVVEVSVLIRTPDGAPVSCASVGAERLEIAFFAEKDDLLSYDTLQTDCSTSSSGSVVFALAVGARSYSRVQLRFVTATDRTVRMCGEEGDDFDAVLEVLDVGVDVGQTRRISFQLVGTSPPCVSGETG